MATFIWMNKLVTYSTIKNISVHPVKFESGVDERFLTFFWNYKIHNKAKAALLCIRKSHNLAKMYGFI